MKELITRYPALSNCSDAIEKAKNILIAAFGSGNKLLICGNGGSCADSDHIVGELMKGFLLRRPVSEKFRLEAEKMFPDNAKYICENLQGALPAIALTAHSGLISAFANDVAADMIYAQQVLGYGKPGDVFLGISTSGNSANVVNAAKVAKLQGLKIIALAGKKQCFLDEIADVVIHAPETETFKVQELHLPIYHYLCAECEREFFDE